MPTVDVVDLNNQKVGELALNDSVFAAEVNESLLYEAVRNYMACQRRGTAKTKVRREVSGSGKKLWRQKGTGRARMGSIRSPLWRHGGTVHGPQPRDYSYKLPKKMAAGALRSALTAKLRDGDLKVVSEFSFPDHKTRSVRTALAALQALQPKKQSRVLVVEAGENRNLTLGSRNLEGVTLVGSRDLSAYHLLGHSTVLVSEAAAKKLSEGLA